MPECSSSAREWSGEEGEEGRGENRGREGDGCDGEGDGKVTLCLHKAVKLKQVFVFLCSFIDTFPV